MPTQNLPLPVAAVTIGGSPAMPAARRGPLGRLFAWLALALLGSSFQALAAPTPYAQADPTAEEQSLLQKLNRARTDPAGEGQRLAAWLRNTADGQSVVRDYGTNPDQVAADFAALPAVPPLAFDAHLLAAARAHAADLAAHGGLGPGAATPDDNDLMGPDGVTLIAHYGYDGSTPASRVAASGFAGNFAGENAAPQALNTDDLHAGYLIDWGNPGLGHRRNAMAAEGTNFVGIGLAPMSSPYPLVETEDFGSLVHYDYILSSHLVPYNGQMVSVPYYVPVLTSPAMLTGVVYHDANGNGQYDAGEGVGGVVVTVEDGGYSAVTSASGGYTLPLTHADGNAIDGAATVRAQFADGSVATHAVLVNTATAAAGPYRANVEWEVQTGASNALPAFFAGSAALPGGWNFLPFPNGNLFGYYNASAYPYLFHNDLGWLYVQDAGDGRQGVYLYDFASGAWWYTGPSYPFPYLYDFKLGTVLYYYPKEGQPGFYTSSPRSFYNFATGQIVRL